MHAETTMEYGFRPVGRIRSCYKQKFAIPRQPGLVAEAPAVIELTGESGGPEAVRELEGFSHIWVLFIFDQHIGKSWNPTVRPPRLGGRRRVGVFASRSPYRPNPIGMSAVRLDRIDREGAAVRLHVLGGDFLDGTPVIDIKPYVAYSDAIPQAEAGFAPAFQPTHTVEFSRQAEENLRRLAGNQYEQIRRVIVSTLSYNPRPSGDDSAAGPPSFASRMFDLDLRWTVTGETLQVVAVSPA